MTLSDYVLVALLVCGALAYCASPTSSWHKPIVSIFAAIASIVGIVSFTQGRWQALAAVAVAVLLLLAGMFRSPASGMRVLIGGVLAILAATCAWPLWMMPAKALPTPDGKLAVGTTVFELADPSRPMDPFHPGTGTRRIQVRAWYPATALPNARIRKYFEGDEARIFGGNFAQQLGLPSFFWDQLRGVSTHSQVDAPLDTSGGPYPVVVFNHGYWSFPTQNTVLMEHLASHGYIAFSISHPGDSSGVRFADGTFVGIPPERPQQVIKDEMRATALEKYFTTADPAERYEQIQQVPKAPPLRIQDSIEPWLRDTQLLMDTIGRGAAEGLVATLFKGADSKSIAIAGMSWGGSMAGTICLLDPRCKAAINLDGMAWDWRLIDTELPVPFLLVQSDSRRMFPDYTGPRRGRADFMYEKISAAGDRKDIVRVMIDGTTHADMTDLTLFVKRPVRTRKVRLGPTPGERIATSINTLALSFLETYLRHRNVGFPDQPLKALPDVHRHDISYVKQWYYATGPGSGQAVAAPSDSTKATQ